MAERDSIRRVARLLTERRIFMIDSFFHEEKARILNIKRAIRHMNESYAKLLALRARIAERRRIKHLYRRRDYKLTTMQIINTRLQ
jgi:hypothetical protein